MHEYACIIADDDAVAVVVAISGGIIVSGGNFCNKRGQHTKIHDKLTCL